MPPLGLNTIYRLPQPRYTLIQVVSEKFFTTDGVPIALASQDTAGNSFALRGRQVTL